MLLTYTSLYKIIAISIKSIGWRQLPKHNICILTSKSQLPKPKVCTSEPSVNIAVQFLKAKRKAQKKKVAVIKIKPFISQIKYYRTSHQKQQQQIIPHVQPLLIAKLIKCNLYKTPNCLLNKLKL